MDNFAEAYVQFGDHEINYQRRFPQWDGLFLFSCHKITLFEKKYEIKLITFQVPFKTSCELGHFIEKTLRITTLHRIIL